MSVWKRVSAVTGAAFLFSLPFAAVAVAEPVGGAEAETFTSVQGYGARVRSDATASGGQYLFVDSNVGVRKTVNVTAPATTLTVRARTDVGVTPANMTILVDGVNVGSKSVAPSTWADFTVTGQWPAGSHTVRVNFTNAAARNLHLDRVTFDSGTTPPPPPGPGETTSTGYLTVYNMQDNDPPNSTAIAFEDVVPGRTGAGGTGTYEDPITAAVPGDGPFQPGDKLYVPADQLYYVVEDLCGTSWTAPEGCTAYVDRYGGAPASMSYSQSEACAERNTFTGQVILNPAPGKPVRVSGPLCVNG